MGVDGSGPSKPVNDPKPQLCFVKKEVDYVNGKLLFLEILAHFFKQVTGDLCYRPFPPMLGHGKSVDLFKLYLCVREKGGYQRVTTNGSWGLVAKDCGFRSRYGLPLKLVYVKYLDALERWLLRLKKDNNNNNNNNNEVPNCDLDVELELKEILVKISGKDDKHANESSEKFDLDCDLVTVKKTRCVNYDVDNVKFVNGRASVVDGTDKLLVKPSIVKGDCSSRKRKRGSDLHLVKWVSEVARNPCDPAIATLPEMSKWKDYGRDVVWKQVLLLRDEMLLERNVDTRAQCSIWQIKQKMHPSMYDDRSGSERLRCSQRVLSVKDPLKRMRQLPFSVSKLSSSHCDGDQVDGPADSSTESVAFCWWKQPRKRLPAVGPQFQADIPKWIGDTCESDSKWLGTRIWPLDKQSKNRMIIERDPIGKGRQDSCGCQSPRSYDCIKFHLFEKRKKVKVELGSAYYQWKFDSMGEEVARFWSREEELKFQDIVKSNLLSEDKSFWSEIFKFFPNKSRESLVSYYFNVFLLRRRGDQNRTNGSNVNSDDDESEYGPKFNCFGRDAKFPSFNPQGKGQLEHR